MPATSQHVFFTLLGQLSPLLCAHQSLRSLHLSVRIVGFDCDQPWKLSTSRYVEHFADPLYILARCLC